jgi:hypothetical protein
MQKFASKLAKDELKKFAKEVGKKLVASDFKHNRVEDPTKVTEKQIKKVKQYVKEYFERVVDKKRKVEREKREKAKLDGVNGSSSNEKGPKSNDNMAELNDSKLEELPSKEEIEVEMSDDDEKDIGGSFIIEQSPSVTTPFETPDLKRKRDDDDFGTPTDDTESNKRFKDLGDTESAGISPPPPPPPPPADGLPEELQESEDQPVKEETEEEREHRLQEEELMRENEEALMMDLDGTLKAEELDSKLHSQTLPHLNGNGLVIDLPAADEDSMDGVEGAEIKHERKSVLSH